MADLLFTITNNGSTNYQVFFRVKGSGAPWNGPHPVAAAVGTYTQLTVSDVDPNTYEFYVIGTCANGIVADASVTFDSFPGCANPTSLNVVRSGSNFIANYSVPTSVAQVELYAEYPNGGTFSQVFGATPPYQITIPIPPGVYGGFVFSIRSVCNAGTGWYSDYVGSVEVNVPDPSICPAPLMGSVTQIQTLPASNTYRIVLGGATSSVSVFVTNNTLGTAQNYLATVTNGYVDIALVKGSTDYNYTLQIYNVCGAGVDTIGTSTGILVPANAPVVNISGWTVSTGPSIVDSNGDGTFGLKITVNTNGLPPSATRNTLVIVRYNCVTTGTAFANVTIAANQTIGITEDYTTYCTVDTASAVIVSAQLL